MSKQVAKNTERHPCDEGKRCFYCNEICEPYHWMKHDPEGAEEEMFGDDWP